MRFFIFIRDWFVFFVFVVWSFFCAILNEIRSWWENMRKH